jgi:proteasome lid subunit RPN8/RPN11
MIDKKIKNYIKKHAAEAEPNEACGFIVLQNDKFKCIKCKNISTTPNLTFEISCKEYLNIKNTYDKIYYIYHTHPLNSNCFDFSDQDKYCSESLAVPIILYNLKNNEIKIYEEPELKKDYIGRFFEIGINDCLSLVEDYFRNELNFIINFYENWKEIRKNLNKNLISAKEVGENIIKDKIFEKNGFKNIKDENLIKNDILVINAIYNKHFAIYLDQNKILHQPIFGFSKIENYCNFYNHVVYHLKNLILQ